MILWWTNKVIATDHATAEAMLTQNSFNVTSGMRINGTDFALLKAKIKIAFFHEAMLHASLLYKHKIETPAFNLFSLCDLDVW